MRTAVYQITVDGQDISSAVDPLLLSVTLTFDDENNADELHLSLDDSYGQIVLPRLGATVSASVGWDDTGAVAAFEGTVDETPSGGGGAHEGLNHHYGRATRALEDGVHSAGGRGQGRVLALVAKSANMRGKVKERKQAHLDDATFGAAARHFAGKADLTAKVDGALSSVKRAYWAMANESFMEWGTRLARELGATFKIFNDTAVFVSRKGGSSVSGRALEGIVAAWGVNLLEWDIVPVISRASFAGFRTRLYDPHQAEWQSGDRSGLGGIGSDAVAAMHTHKFKAPTKDQATAQSGANGAESARESGGSDHVTIDGEPMAQPGASCAVSGVRPGVDGTYLISAVTHSLSRGAGFTTQLTLKQPSGGAGTDDRGGAGAGGQ